MDEQTILTRFRKHSPQFLQILGADFVAADSEAGICTMEFDISHDFCHSVDVVQGGFVTAMLDAAMSHAAFALGPEIVGVSSLEIKTTYLEPTRAGRLRVEGQVLRSSHRIAFMEGRIHDQQGLLTATGSSVAKLVRRK